MKSATFIAAAVWAMAVSAKAIPKRELGGVLLCNGANATGECSYKVYPLNECQQLEAPFYQNTSTFAPDGEEFFCYPKATNCTSICKSPTGCTFGQVDFDYEHKFNLSAIGWNTIISSFQCGQRTVTKS